MLDGFEFARGMVVDSMPESSADGLGHILLLDQVLDFKMIAQNLLCWKNDFASQFLFLSFTTHLFFIVNIDFPQILSSKKDPSPLYVPAGITSDELVDLHDFALVLTAMIELAAFEGGEKRFLADTGWKQEICCLLEWAEFVVRIDDSSGEAWQLKLSALEHVCVCWSLHSPHRVCDVRPFTSIEDMTTFELVLLMQRRGWRWQKWVARSKHSVGQTMPDGYKHGAEGTNT